MKHLGDITKINGFDVPPVNVVIGGSPCQDLSIAGKRAGLAGERSGLFMEQLRVIKEMREADANRGRKGKDIRPRFMVWENVPGAFSSNNGADFGAVLQETVRVVCKEAPVVPMPKNGWPKAGCLYGVDGNGGGWSVAWRVFDAQFWGVPQRRSRIALVADFGGCGAPEILFERKSVSRYSEQSEQTREETTGTVRDGTSEHDRVLGDELTCYGLDRASFNQGQNAQFGFTVLENQAPTMVAKGPGAVCQPIPINLMIATRDKALGERTGLGIAKAVSIEPGIAAREGGHCYEDVSGTLRANAGDNQMAVCQPVFCLQGNGIDRADTAGCNGAGWKEGTSYTLNTIDRPAVAFEAVCAGFSPQQGAKANGIGWQEECSPTLRSALCGFPSPAVVYDSKVVFDARGNGEGNISPTITGDHENRVTDYTAVCVEKLIRWIVRRLTPLECERLQGFPDGWTDIGDWTDSKGKKHTAADTPRYKALGNSIALPSWFYVLQKLSLFCGSECTMASLFDGIGGFPLIWESLNGKGSCLWASEIEEFPIAVTSLRFAVDT